MPPPITLDSLMRGCLKGSIISPLPIRHSASLSKIANDLKVEVEELKNESTNLGVLPGNGYEFGGCLIHQGHYLWTQISNRGEVYVNCQPVR